MTSEQETLEEAVVNTLAAEDAPKPDTAKAEVPKDGVMIPKKYILDTTEEGVLISKDFPFGKEKMQEPPAEPPKEEEKPKESELEKEVEALKQSMEKFQTDIMAKFEDLSKVKAEEPPKEEKPKEAPKEDMAEAKTDSSLPKGGKEQAEGKTGQESADNFSRECDLKSASILLVKHLQ